MPGLHSLLSPSGAKQWMACPPSIRAGEAIEDTETEAAREGTLAHGVGEVLLEASLESLDGNEANAIMREIQKDELYDATMFEHAKDYADYCLEVFAGAVARHKIELAKNPNLKIGAWVERNFTLDQFVPDGAGTSDFTCLGGGRLDVIDFKYGQGIEVAVENNPQLMSYALGAYLELGKDSYIDTVVVHVHQPRKNNVASWSISAAELIEWAESTLKPAAALAFAGEGERCAGDHCTFCKVANRCRTLAEHNLEAAKLAFAEPAELSNKELGEIVNKAAGLEKWLKQIKAYVLAEALNGQKFEGVKLVEGRGKRVVLDPDELVETLTDLFGFEPSLFWERSLLSMTAMEKIVGKKAFAQLSDGLIEKRAGSIAIAPTTDKRREYKPEKAAEEAFADELNEDY